MENNILIRNMNEHQPTIQEAESLRGVNIHLGYLSQTMREIKDDMKDTKAQMIAIGNAFVSRTDFEEHLKADEDHELRIRVLEQSMWKYIGASGAISALISLIGSILIQHYIH